MLLRKIIAYVNSILANNFIYVNSNCLDQVCMSNFYELWSSQAFLNLVLIRLLMKLEFQVFHVLLKYIFKSYIKFSSAVNTH